MKLPFSRRLLSTKGSDFQWLFARLTNRSLLRIRGDGVLQFLQGIVTNDTRYLSKSVENYRSSLYSMMLNTQGRLLYDLILYVDEREQYESGREDVYVECDQAVVEEVTNKLTFYRLRRKLTFESCDKEMTIHTVFPKSHADPIPTRLNIPREEMILLCNDPRVTQLGYRAVLPSDKEPMKIFPAQEVTESEYRAFRYRLGVAEGCADLPPGAAFPLEANGDYMNGVSFHKGCYVGQELTARTHHTGVVRKRLMPLKFDVDASDVRINAKITDDKGGNLGKFRRAIGQYGLGLLYVHEALSATGMHVQTEQGETIKCSTEKPAWWVPAITNLEGGIRGFHTKPDEVKEQEV